MNDLLMDFKYQKSRLLLKIFEDNGHKIRLIGGCVRDQLLNILPKDYDLATTALPNEVISILNKNKIKNIPTGIAHGTITACFAQASFEITTLREDVQTDGRHAKVIFGKSFKKDAFRRDFTINSLSQDIHGKIYDYCDGLNHLQDKKLRFIGDPNIRIKEDYLRILRYFRFQARLDFSFHEEAIEAIQKNREGLLKISKERILHEIKEIFNAKKNANVLEYMISSKVLYILFTFLDEINWVKNIDISLFKRFINDLSNEKSLLKWEQILSAFILISHETNPFTDVKSECDKICKNLRMPNKSIKKIKFLTFYFEKIRKNKLSSTEEILLLADEYDKNTSENFIQESIVFWVKIAKFFNHKSDLNFWNMFKESLNKNNYLRKKNIPLKIDYILDTFDIINKSNIHNIIIDLKKEIYKGNCQDKISCEKYLSERFTRKKNK